MWTGSEMKDVSTVIECSSFISLSLSLDCIFWTQSLHIFIHVWACEVIQYQLILYFVLISIWPEKESGWFHNFKLYEKKDYFNLETTGKI